MTDARMRPALLKAMESLDTSAGEELDPRLRAMVRLRCSHLNGCAYSVRIHSDALAALGARVDLIAALARPVNLMREDAVNAAEAAALRFAEILTDAPRGLEVEARKKLRRHFTIDQIGQLVEVVALVNAWNRVIRASD